MNSRMIILYTLALFIVSVFAWAGNGTTEECEGTDSGTYFQACTLGKETKELDTKLNGTFRNLLKAYKKDGMLKEYKMLIEAQRAWIHFRDKTCEFENQAIGGINSISGARCQNTMTRERLKYLQDY